MLKFLSSFPTRTLRLLRISISFKHLQSLSITRILSRDYCVDLTGAAQGSFLVSMNLIFFQTVFANHLSRFPLLFEGNRIGFYTSSILHICFQRKYWLNHLDIWFFPSQNLNFISFYLQVALEVLSYHSMCSEQEVSQMKQAPLQGPYSKINEWVLSYILHNHRLSMHVFEFQWLTVWSVKSTGGKINTIHQFLTVF